MKKIAIAIDGPSGAGKSTIARAASAKYKIVYVDTGAMYRTIGLAAQYAGVGSKDKEGIIALLPSVHIEMSYDDEGVQRMLLDGKDVSTEIRTPLSSIYASDVSAIPEVRTFLMDMQRNMAKRHSVIMDGRDIGTVVLPDAEVKIFLTASPEARAQRRFLELEQKGMPTPYEEVLRDIQYRDAQDSSRATAPLKPAEDSVILDTTELNFEESLAAACKIIEAVMLA